MSLPFVGHLLKDDAGALIFHCLSKAATLRNAFGHAVEGGRISYASPLFSWPAEVSSSFEFAVSLTS